MLVKLDHFPDIFGGNNSKILWNRHLVFLNNIWKKQIHCSVRPCSKRPNLLLGNQEFLVATWTFTMTTSRIRHFSTQDLKSTNTRPYVWKNHVVTPKRHNIYVWDMWWMNPIFSGSISQRLYITPFIPDMKNPYKKSTRISCSSYKYSIHEAFLGSLKITVTWFFFRPKRRSSASRCRFARWVWCRNRQHTNTTAGGWPADLSTGMFYDGCKKR